MAAQPKIDWDTGLCDCCKDMNTCCYGFWCCPCLACTVSGRFGENCCLPLCDLCSPAITTAFAIPLIPLCGPLAFIAAFVMPFCAPPAGLSTRAAMRNRYGIEGSLCKDIPISCFCGICSWCQMHRELKHRNKTPTVIDTQPQNIMQPPVMNAPAYPPEVPLES